MLEACSFCKKDASQVRKLIRGGFHVNRPVFICDACVMLAGSPLATVAYCAHCVVVNGKHDPTCGGAA